MVSGVQAGSLPRTPVICGNASRLPDIPRASRESLIRLTAGYAR